MESDSKLMHLGADRLSSLPVELALRILARLPTKSVIAVVTTVKSWYNDRIWTSLRDLDFDQELIFHEENNEDELTFCNFVDRILGLAVPPIHKLKLCADVEPEQSIGWIAEAVRLYPVEIHFEFSETVLLPDILLSLNSVQTLALNSHVEVPNPLPINLFPSLHTLRVQNHFNHHDFFGANFFQNLPMLRELYLEGTIGEDSSVTLNLVLPRLERLDISLTSLADPGVEMDDCRVVIDGPKLEYVSLYSDFAVHFQIISSPVVVTARLRLGVCAQGRENLVGGANDDYYDEDFGEVEAGGEGLGEEVEYALSVFNLLSRLTSVHSLFLSSPTRYVLNVAAASGNTLPTFPHLTRLELGISYCCGWFFPSTVFRDSPILERIVIRGDARHGGPVAEGGMNWQPPTFLPISLNEVEILNVDGYQRVRRFVEHLVTNANGMKRLVFGSCELSVEQEDLLRISLAGRGCEVIVTR